MSKRQSAARVEQLEVWSKTRRMLEYDADPDTPGRPLMMLLGGASLAFLALAFIAMAAYRTWVLEENSPNRAFMTISLLFVIHAIGVYVFAYGYELYDHGKALRLTVMITLVSFGAIVAVIAAIILMMRMKDVASGAGSFLQREEKPVLASEAAGFFPFSVPASPALGRFDHLDAAPRPFAITCAGCARKFEPSPPRAVCPYCGLENVKVA